MCVPSSDPSFKVLPLTLYCIAYSSKELRVLPLLLPKVLKASKYLSLRLLLPTYLPASPGKPSPLSWLLFHSFGSPGAEWVLKYLLRDELECQTQRGCLLPILSGVAWSPAHLLHQAVDRRGSQSQGGREKWGSGTSLVVWWVRLLPLQEAWVWSRFRELRSCMPHAVAKKKKWGSEELSLRIDGSSGESLPNEDTSGGCIGPAPVG